MYREWWCDQWMDCTSVSADVVIIGVLCIEVLALCIVFFFFNDTATTEIYTLSLHDALPIYLQFLNRKPLETQFSRYEHIGPAHF